MINNTKFRSRKDQEREKQAMKKIKTKLGKKFQKKEEENLKHSPKQKKIEKKNITLLLVNQLTLNLLGLS